jgi:8-oxo-dGTP pyrophosphatase MutT (NUDIX family)
MSPIYTIFIDHRRIDFIHTSSKKSFCNKSSTASLLDWEQFTAFIHSNKNRFCCISDDPARSFRRFSTYFYPLEAAGGLVVNAQKQWLFIFRNGVWDLPKGVIEAGERTENAAVREVEEECGIHDLQIIKALPETYHMYRLDDKKWILKKTHWFLMFAGSDISLKPQVAEGITSAEWRFPDQIEDIRESTYGSIKELLDHCLM